LGFSIGKEFLSDNRNALNGAKVNSSFRFYTKKGKKKNFSFSLQ
jgi:hypothetical protein